MSMHNQLSVAALFLLLIAMSTVGAGMVGGWRPQPPNSESVTRNSHFAAKQINMRANSLQHKKLINVHSAESQVVAGVKYRLVFDIATTTCRKNDANDPENCNEFNKEMPVERCTAVVVERAWLNEQDLVEFTCERHMTHDEYFSAENQAKEKEFKEQAIAAANAL